MKPENIALIFIAIAAIATILIFKKIKLSSTNPPPSRNGYAAVVNFITIDSIDNKLMKSFYWEFGRKKKGLFADKTEVVYLEEGEHMIAAHGVTYQTETAYLEVDIKADATYILGSNSDGLFFYETKDKSKYLK